MGKGIALKLLYSQVPKRATLTGRHQPRCSQIIASASNLQISADGKSLVLRLGRPVPNIHSED